MTAPACNPDTLAETCHGCGRRMHRGRRRGGERRMCAAGHPCHAAHSLCRSCTPRNLSRRDRPVMPPVNLDRSWWGRANCRGADRDLFFPDIKAGFPARPVVGPVAERWCLPCPVRDACTAHAEQAREVGLWGGVWRRRRGGAYERVQVLPAERIAS